LDQGLSERAGTPKPQDTALYANIAKIERAPSTLPKREYARVDGPLRAYAAARWKEAKSDALRSRVAMRAKIAGVEEYLMAFIASPAHPLEERKSVIGVLEELGGVKIVPNLLVLLQADQPESIRLASLRALARFDDPSITRKLLALYPAMSAQLKT